ncbi:hypothetical protein GCM10025859_49030 [Alicyclobacillus fastidiosus]|nr:hypothetical protein GCM10025859_49030 [Alicyclobacillus fastidiosus]
MLYNLHSMDKNMLDVPDDSPISQRIETLRRQLIRIVESNGDLTHPDVIALSQELDALMLSVIANGFD